MIAFVVMVVVLTAARNVRMFTSFTKVIIHLTIVVVVAMSTGAAMTTSALIVVVVVVVVVHSRVLGNGRKR